MITCDETMLIFLQWLLYYQILSVYFTSRNVQLFHHNINKSISFYMAAIIPTQAFHASLFLPHDPKLKSLSDDKNLDRFKLRALNFADYKS